VRCRRQRHGAKQGRQASAAFLKKSSKRLFILRIVASAVPYPTARNFFTPPGGQLFFSKREALAFTILLSTK
jgi:hypothetical protein